MSTEQTLTIINKFCQALAGRDHEEVIKFFAEQVDWYIPGNEKVAPWLGKRTTQKEVSVFFQQLWTNTEPLEAHIDHIFADGKSGVITGEFTTRMLQTGKVVNSIFSIHITVANSLIVRYRLQEDSYAVAAALET